MSVASVKILGMNGLSETNPPCGTPKKRRMPPEEGQGGRRGKRGKSKPWRSPLTKRFEHSQNRKALYQGGKKKVMGRKVYNLPYTILHREMETCVSHKNAKGWVEYLPCGVKSHPLPTPLL